MHSCHECGQACDCNGDIEDLMWGDDSEEAQACEHVCGPEDDDLGIQGCEEAVPHRGGYAATEQE